MVVCHCLAMNDSVIADLARQGAVSVDSIVDTCGAGGQCGGCRPLIAEILSGLDPTPRTALQPTNGTLTSDAQPVSSAA